MELWNFDIEINNIVEIIRNIAAEIQSLKRKYCIIAVKLWNFDVYKKFCCGTLKLWYKNKIVAAKIQNIAAKCTG